MLLISMGILGLDSEAGVLIYPATVLASMVTGLIFGATALASSARSVTSVAIVLASGEIAPISVVYVLASWETALTFLATYLSLTSHPAPTLEH
jgi:hypothetical protein